MKASPELMLFAKFMLAIFVALAVFSLAAMVRSFYRPLNATPEKAAAFKKLVLFNGWIMLAAIGVAVQAITNKQYYLLGASAILFSYVLPAAVQYVRLKAALAKGQKPPTPGNAG